MDAPLLVKTVIVVNTNFWLEQKHQNLLLSHPGTILSYSVDCIGETCIQKFTFSHELCPSSIVIKMPDNNLNISISCLTDRFAIVKSFNHSNQSWMLEKCKRIVDIGGCVGTRVCKCGLEVWGSPSPSPKFGDGVGTGIGLKSKFGDIWGQVHKGNFGDIWYLPPIIPENQGQRQGKLFQIFRDTSGSRIL